MVTSGFHLWQFQVFNSGAGGLVVILFWLDLWEIFFLATLGFWTQGTSGSLVLHSTTMPWWLLVFTSDNFRYLTQVQRDWWWYCSDWTCERFSFCPHWCLKPGTSGSLVLHSYHCTKATSGFSPLTISGIWLWCRGIGGGIVLIGPVRDFLFVLTGVWTRDLWISSAALYHCTKATSGFHLWQFQVFDSGAEGLVVVLFLLDLWEIFLFWHHWCLNLGPLDL